MQKMMKMKKIFSVVLFLFALVPLFAQGISEYDQRILVKYPQDQIQQMMINSPGEIEAMNYELQFGYEIVTMPAEKSQAFETLHYRNLKNKQQGSVVESVDSENFNLYLYDYNRELDKNTYYKIMNTDFVLVVFSNKKLVKSFNKSRGYEK
jgi:hypothetical protein